MLVVKTLEHRLQFLAEGDPAVINRKGRLELAQELDFFDPKNSRVAI